MPFTFSHPAIILPLYKAYSRWFSLTGLVIGSMTPDFEYFIRMRLRSNISHSLIGVFLFDLPMGVMLSFVFHNVVRQPLCANSPLPIRQKMGDFVSFNWNEYFRDHWFIACASIVLGALSHLFWDGWTHGRGPFVEMFPILISDVNILVISLPIYRILQHVSTILGALVIFIFIYRIPDAIPSNAKQDRKYWPLVVLITLIIVILRCLVKIESNFVGHLVVTGISACCISLATVPFLIRYKNQQ